MAQTPQLKRIAGEMYESWYNGNRNHVDAWIASRLLAIISYIAGHYGSDYVRQFLDSIRHRRDF